MATNPTFSVTLDSNDITRPLTYQDATFTVAGIWEGLPVQKDTDLFKVLPVVGVDTIGRIIVMLPADETGTVRITTSTPEIQTLPFTEFFVYQPTAAQAALITEVAVSVDSNTDITVDARILGV